MRRNGLRSAGAIYGVLALGLGFVGATAPAHAYDFIKHRGNLPAVGGTGPEAAANIDIIENLGEKLPKGLVFADSKGQPVALDSFLNRGKPILLTMGYYNCPMLCNLVHQGLSKSIKVAGLVLGKDFDGLAVSIDPNESAKSANTNQGRLLRSLDRDRREDWPFLMDAAGTDGAASRTLAKAVGFRYVYDEKVKQFAHAAAAFVISPDGTIARYVYGVDFSPRDLRFALVEAGGGRVGTSLDRVLLTCFKYDPMAQRYTPYLFGFVRLGSLLCFMALASLLAVLWRREYIMRRSRRIA